MATHPLESILGVTVKDQGLLERALVHPSYVNEVGGRPAASYERMEFLGDTVLELAVSTHLYQRLPDHSEGDLTKGRASLVCGESLAGVARRLSLGDFIAFGKGEGLSGGSQRESTLAAAMEAVVAAVYLDQGFLEAQKFVLRVMAPEFKNYLESGVAPPNAKSLLQEEVQSKGMPSPLYRLVDSQGPPHNPEFTVEVLVDGEVAGQGRGSKKADAEREAARNALAHLSG